MWRVSFGESVNYWVSSDLHIQHKNILKLCPGRGLIWDTVEDMAEDLIKRHNELVKTDDIILWLGDLFLGDKEVGIKKYLHKFNGNKVVLAGNHDWLPTEDSKSRCEKFDALYRDCGISEIYQGCIKLSDITGDSSHGKIHLCHFPPTHVEKVAISSGNYVLRYSNLRPTIHEDEYLICGHVHSQQHLLATNCYHCGIDATIHNFAPVRLEDILTRLEIK